MQTFLCVLHFKISKFLLPKIFFKPNHHSLYKGFGWRRIILRTTLMLLVLFVAETIPHFAVALELVGGLLTTPLVFIFPPWFYAVIKVRKQRR